MNFLQTSTCRLISPVIFIGVLLRPPIVFPSGILIRNCVNVIHEQKSEWIDWGGDYLPSFLAACSYTPCFLKIIGKDILIKSKVLLQLLF